MGKGEQMKDLLQVARYIFEKVPKIENPPSLWLPNMSIFSFLLFSEFWTLPEFKKRLSHLINEFKIHHLYSLITNHDDFDNADPSRMQDACHMNEWPCFHKFL